MTIYDMFTSIVAHTATKSGIAVSYQYGHPIEIIENLQEMSLNLTQSAAKYPLIALFTDVSETKGEADGVDMSVKLHLIIATLTLNSYKSPERLTLNFTPVLYPLYEQLLKSIASSGYFLNPNAEKIEHEKVDRFFWGKNGLYLNTGNVFNDYVDCIEVSNLKLTVKKQC